MEPSVASSTCLTNGLHPCPQVDRVSAKKPASLYPATSVRSPLSAYEWFVQLTKKDHFRRNPQLNRTPEVEESVETECGERWPGISSMARKQFTNLETVDISRYNFQIRKAIGLETAEKANREKNKKKREKKVRPEGKPIKPKAAFFHFHAAERLSMEKYGLSSRIVVSRLAKRWRELPAEDKLPFEKKYEEEKSLFDSRMLKWRLGNIASGRNLKDKEILKERSGKTVEVIDLSSRGNSETDIREIDACKTSRSSCSTDVTSDVPETSSPDQVPSIVVGSNIDVSRKGKRGRKKPLPYRTAYQLYMTDMMRKLSKTRVNEKIELVRWKSMFGQISLRWKNLPSAEREKYSRLADEYRKKCQAEQVVSSAASWSVSEKENADEENPVEATSSSMTVATAEEKNLFDRFHKPKASLDVQPVLQIQGILKDSFQDESWSTSSIPSVDRVDRPEEIVVSSTSSTTTASSSDQDGQSDHHVDENFIALSIEAMSAEPKASPTTQALAISPDKKGARQRTGRRGGTPKQVAFSLWYQENKERIRREFGPLANTAKGDLMKRSRALFKSLPDDEQSILFRRAKEKIVERRPKIDGVSPEAERRFSPPKVLTSDFQACIDATDVLLGVKKSLTEDLEELEEGVYDANEDVEGEVTQNGDIAGSKFIGGCAEAISGPIVENADLYEEYDVAERCILGGFADEFGTTAVDNFAETSIVDLADDFAEDNVTETKFFGDVAEDNVMMEEEEEKEDETVAETSILEEDNAGEYIFESSFESNAGNDDGNDD